MANHAGKTNWFERILKGVSNIGMLLTNLFMVAMLVIIMLNVVLRYVVGKPVTGGDTAMIFLMIMMVFTGLGSIVLSGSNIRMTALVDRVSRRKQQVLAAICGVANVIYFAILVWAGVVRTQNSFATKVYDEATEWVLWPVQAVMTLGLALALIATIWVAYRKFVAKDDEGGKGGEDVDVLDSSIINE